VELEVGTVGEGLKAGELQALQVHAASPPPMPSLCGIAGAIRRRRSPGATQVRWGT
jgi:hypothetical protein